MMTSGLDRRPLPNRLAALRRRLRFVVTRRGPVDETQGSPSLRREAVERTLRQIQALDFGCVVNADGLGWAGMALAGTLSLVCALVCLNPALALTALERFAVPFGNKDFPP